MSLGVQVRTPGNAVRSDALDRRIKLVKKALLILVLIALALAGVAYYTQHHNGRSQADDFRIARVEFNDIRDTFSVSASIRPLDVIPIFSMISGQVMERNADFNATVVEGQTLLKLDPRDAQNKVNKANAALNAAQAGVDLANAQLNQAEKARSAANLVREEVTRSQGSGPVDRVK